jgi:hypothetical protein
MVKELENKLRINLERKKRRINKRLIVYCRIKKAKL